MCNTTGMVFGITNLGADEIADKRVLDVGARDFNGGLREVLANFNPSEHVGVDLHDGPGVDVMCDVNDLVERFGEESFDVVITTELLEHVEQWRGAISNLKRVLRPGGLLVVATRSPGFKCHGYPYDFWRYRPEDMETIFADFDDLTIASDPEAPGVFLKARKPMSFEEVELDEIKLYSIITGQFEHSVLPKAVKRVQRNYLWYTRLRRVCMSMIDWPLRVLFPIKK